MNKELNKYVSLEVLEKIKEEINLELREYLLEEIIPIYNSLDDGHGVKHIGTVIDSSIKLCMVLNLRIDLNLTSAVFHDLGMLVDRKTHHIHSKKMVMENIKLKKWFKEDEIKLISEACEDHRASNKNEPRSIYGYILSDADRTTNIFDMIIRCYNFSIKHFDDKTYEDLYNRVYEHLKEKYGEGGYAKFYLKESFDIIMRPYLEAQEILKEENKFKLIYEELIPKK